MRVLPTFDVITVSCACIRLFMIFPLQGMSYKTNEGQIANANLDYLNGKIICEEKFIYIKTHIKQKIRTKSGF